MSSYWITINKKALVATSKAGFNSAAFDAADNNAQQHWLILTADKLTAFDQFCTAKALPKLDSILADAKESMETGTVPTSEEITLEETAEPMTNLIASIEAEKEAYSVGDIEDAVQSLRTTFIAYLANVQPASPEQPIPVSWLIENRSFDENADGWTNGPESIKNGVAEFKETTFNTYQTLSPALPAGNYALTLNAFQRPGTYQNTYNTWKEGDKTVKAQLYATANTKTTYQIIQNIWDGACETKKTGQCVNYNDLFIPNNVAAADSWFTEGLYENLLPVTLTSASTLKIGIRCTKSDASWWTCYDNFGLQFFGNYDVSTGIASPLRETKEGAAWYDLNGRKLSGKPHRKGVYINSGKKIVIK